MIPGVVSQETAGRLPPSDQVLEPQYPGGMFFEGIYFSGHVPGTVLLENGLGAMVLRNIDRALSPQFFLDPTDAFYSAASGRQWVLAPQELVIDSNFETVFAFTSKTPTQFLVPSLYVSVDALSLPSIRLPGLLQVGLFANDDVLFTPFVIVSGALRAAMFTELDAIYAPSFTTPLTLHPSRPVDIESFYAPLMRAGVIQPLLHVDNDIVRAFVTKVSMAAGLVANDDMLSMPAAIGIPATLDGPIQTLAMSNGNLTATVTSAGATAGVRSTALKTDNKFYFEMTVGLFHDVYTALGICQTTIDYAGLLPAVRVNVASGGIVSNGTDTGYNVGAGANGDIYGFAVDLSARLMWFRRFSAPWNGTPAANPVTGTNGVTIPAGAWTPFVRFAIGSLVGDNVTANFGQSAFFAAVPAGFGLWSNVVAKLQPPIVTDGDVFRAPTAGQIISPAMFDSDAFYAPVLTGGAVALATLDGDSSNVALSNGNLTATHANNATNSGARSTAQRTTGKYYFEVRMTLTHGNFDTVAIVTADAVYYDFVTGVANCVSLQRGAGAIYANNTNSGKSLGACTSGDVISFAVDLTARKAWLRKNGGNWNGLTLSLENPNTGVGGVTIAASQSFAPAVGFGGSGTVASDAMTANFGQSAYIYTRPIGFGDWQATITTVVVPTSFNGVPVNTVLSNSNLTATHSSTTGSSGARSAINKTNGKYYFEVTVGETRGRFDCVGLMYSGGNFSGIGSAINVTVTYCSFGGGGIWYYSSDTGKNVEGNIVAGDIIGIATDLDNLRTWFRKNGGPWNGDPTADPVVGIGSVGTPSNPSPFVGFDGVGTAVGDNFTGNFGQLPFTFPAPSGYGIWTVPAILQTIIPNIWIDNDVFFLPTYVADHVILQAISAVMSNDDAVYAPSVTQVSAPAVFASPAATDMAITNNSLTATRSAVTIDASGAVGNVVQSTGKFYCEFVRGASHGGSDSVGLMLSGQSGTTGYTNMRNGQLCATFFTNFGPGQIYANNGNPGSIPGSPVAGDVVGCAVDLGAHLVWFRKNGGLWNNSGTANPATGVGGFTIAAGSYTAAITLANTSTIGDTVTANFGTTAYRDAAPSGFANWMTP